ncbi:Ku protein [soil metagenome]
MSARPSWSGFLKFNLISIPVKGYNAAASGGGKIGFHMLHAKCHERIRYKKVCPVHGEVENDEIVNGYEVSKGKYVVVDKEERKGVRSEDDKTIDVDAFVPPQAIDPLFFSGKTYYLLPDGKVGQQPYAVMLEAMRQQERYAVARVVFAGRAQVCVVHATSNVLAMTLLAYESELKLPATFEEELKEVASTTQERKLACTLISAATDQDFNLAQYKDEYTNRLSKLVEGKVKRAKKLVGPAHEEQPAIINLMDALKQSLDKAKKSHTRTVPQKATAHSKKKATGHGRRKTG